jgi:C1A family cysteine protease
MDPVKIESIRKEIENKKAGWQARENEFLNRPHEELKRKLGVIPDHEQLQKLRALPRPDIIQIIADFKGLRLKQNSTDSSGIFNEKFIELVSNLLFFTNEDPAAIAQMNADPNLALKKLQISPFPFPIFWQVDWRNRKGRNNVTPVKDQGYCGSCVSFGTTATLESMLLIEHNVSLDLSEAELLFCGGGSCGGWWPDSAVSYLVNKGISQETCFPYQPHNMACSTCFERDNEAIKITNNVVLWDIAQRKQYLRAVGPVMCVFEVYDDFYSYGTGVYSHVTGGFVGLHCVEVIGYNELSGCWICKNSWGTGWGDGGYFNIAYGQCGIDSTYPFWGIGGTKWFLP